MQRGRESVGEVGVHLVAIPDGSLVVEFAIAPRPGMKKVVPLGTWGELGIEAA